MAILRKYLDDVTGNEITERLDGLTFEDAKTDLLREFDESPNACRFEEVKYENGRRSVMIKDRSNKIIIQYKTI